MTQQDKELLQRANDKKMLELASNFEPHDWQVILTVCPPILKWESFKRDYMKLSDLAMYHAEAERRIEKVYADEDMQEWL